MAKKSIKTSSKLDTKEVKNNTEKKKTSTVHKDKKDKVKSNKALSPYFKFMQEQRPLVTKQLPQLSNKELITELAKRWKSLSQADKDKYKTK